MTTFKDVAKAYQIYKDTEKIYKELSSELVEDMQSRGVSKEETEFGKFTVSSRTTYQFTDKVDKLKEKLELAKVKEINSGVAKAKQGSTSLRVTLPKV